MMNRGAGRQAVFFDDEDRRLFGRLLTLAHERFGVEVHAYCLMTNHVHLLVHCPQGRLSEAMQLVGSVYTRATNERVGRDGPLFRGRFHSLPVTSDDHLLSAVRYIHRNPLDIAGVSHPVDYRWSSHRTYLGQRPCPPFVRTDEVLARFGGDRALFDRFVSADPGAPERSAASAVDVSSLAAMVQLVLDELLDDDRPARLHRTVLALVLDRLEPAAAEQLRRTLGYSGRQAEAVARRRARRRLCEVPALGHVVERALDLSRRTHGV